MLVLAVVPCRGACSYAAADVCLLDVPLPRLPPGMAPVDLRVTRLGAGAAGLATAFAEAQPSGGDHFGMELDSGAASICPTSIFIGLCEQPAFVWPHPPPAPEGVQAFLFGLGARRLPFVPGICCQRSCRRPCSSGSRKISGILLPNPLKVLALPALKDVLTLTALHHHAELH